MAGHSASTLPTAGPGLPARNRARWAVPAGSTARRRRPRCRFLDSTIGNSMHPQMTRPARRRARRSPTPRPRGRHRAAGLRENAATSRPPTPPAGCRRTSAGACSRHASFTRGPQQPAKLGPLRKGSTPRPRLAWREFYFSILHHFPEVLETEFNPDLARTALGRARQALRRMVRGTHRISDRRCGNAPAHRHRLDAQPGENDHRDVPNQGPPRRLAARRAVLHAPPLDGEIASNNGGWQWSAGTGADAAPYFRIQNPWLQTARHDPDGDYIRRWIPELADVPAPTLHVPAQGRPPDRPRLPGPDRRPRHRTQTHPRHVPASQGASPIVPPASRRCQPDRAACTQIPRRLTPLSSPPSPSARRSPPTLPWPESRNSRPGWPGRCSRPTHSPAKIQQRPPDRIPRAENVVLQHPRKAAAALGKPTAHLVVARHRVVKQLAPQRQRHLQLDLLLLPAGAAA